MCFAYFLYEAHFFILKTCLKKEYLESFISINVEYGRLLPES
jgi:hypothetical protein